VDEMVEIQVVGLAAGCVEAFDLGTSDGGSRGRQAVKTRCTPIPRSG